MENYEVLRQIGKGSYGEVHLVRDLRNSKKVELYTLLLVCLHVAQYVLKKMDLVRASQKDKDLAKREVGGLCNSGG